MDTNSPTIQLCLAGNRAEFDGKIDEARALFRQAWDAAQGDYEACIAAHYVARHQNPPDTLHWNQVALACAARAEAANDERVQSFYPSLYVNLGHAYEQLGQQAEAAHYYQLAADLGLIHQKEA